MECTLALLADGANVTPDGKLNVLGVFNALGAAKYPVTHPQMFLVVRLETSNAESGMQKKVEIQLSDEDGKKLFAINANLTVPKGSPGAPIRMNHILALNGIQFQKPGNYAFNVFVNGDIKAAVDLKLFQAKQPPKPTAH